jgi:hypothetical protein
MALVVFISIALWMAIPAYLVATDSQAGFISHLYMRNDTRQLFAVGQTHADTFWPRYFRRLLGQPWPGSYVCVSCKQAMEKNSGCEVVELESSTDGGYLMGRLQRLDMAHNEAEAQRQLRQMARAKGTP